MGSIFNDVKLAIGLVPEYKAFDLEILIQINAAFSTLTQLGVGPKEGFRVDDEVAIWEDFECESDIQLGLIKDYVFLKVKHTFDPPASSSVMQAIENQIKELEWRLNVQAENEEVENE